MSKYSATPKRLSDVETETELKGVNREELLRAMEPTPDFWDNREITSDIIGIAGVKGTGSITEAALLELSGREYIQLTKMLIDTVVNAICYAYSAQRALPILTDILNNSNAFGLVGKAYFNADDTCIINIPKGPLKTNMYTAATYWNTELTRNEVQAIINPDTEIVAALVETYVE